MSRKLLSAEEIAELRQNPHVKNVSPRSVIFSAEFKQIAYEAMVRGERLASILEMYGINSGALGEVRIQGMAQRLYEFAQREEGFRPQNGRKKRDKEEIEEENLRKRLQRLENELAYTRQEVEFKKHKRQIRRLGDNGNPSESRSKVCLDRRSCSRSAQPAVYHRTLQDRMRVAVGILPMAGIETAARGA